MKRSLRSLLFAAVAALSGLSCDDTSANFSTLGDLEFRLVESSIGANLMPFVPPDPVWCAATLVVKNAEPLGAIAGLSFPSSKVRLTATGELLGTVSFTSTWDGRLDPLEEDTVRIRKIASPAPLFPAPCGELVNLELTIRSINGGTRGIAFDSLLFSCVY
jgi:hypothetical protein